MPAAERRAGQARLLEDLLCPDGVEVGGGKETIYVESI
jgi:hypothetical protein